MSADSLRALLVRYAEAWENDDRDGWLDTFAPGATQEDPIGEGVRGAFLEASRALAPQPRRGGWSRVTPDGRVPLFAS